MVETHGSVKLFGVTIKAAAERWDPPKGRRDLKDPINDKSLNEFNINELVDSGENSEPAASSIETEHNEVPQEEEDHTEDNGYKLEEKQDGISNLQEKPLKKPTEILPCPRCQSLDTKFCYFNNYNVNQPRHFCKACQRYWTDGGSIRNMAVGAGRRKSKSSISQYKHTALLSATIQSIPPDILVSFNHPEQDADGATGAYRRGMFPSKSCEKFLDLNGEVNYNTELCEGVVKPSACPPNIAEIIHSSNGPFMAYSSSPWEKGHEGPTLQGFQAYKLHAPCSNSLQWNPDHAFSTPYMPVSFHQVNSDQNTGKSGSLGSPTLVPMTSITPSTSSCTTPSGSGLTSTFSKHLTDGSILGKKRGKPCDNSVPNSQENSTWTSIRMDDPNEAAKSSIWTTMRKKGTARDGFCFRGLSNIFQPRAENMNEKKEISNALHANPSAWLRSLEFHENIQWRKDTVDIDRQI